MIRDPSYATRIAGLVIVYEPKALQDRVLKNSYRNFKQRIALAQPLRVQEAPPW